MPAPAEDVAAAIAAEARRVPGTLVAICTHGRSGVLHAVFGSVALQVLRTLGEPLVVYRPYIDAPSTLSKVGRVVLAFTSARAADGGTGAVYVLLRRRRGSKEAMAVYDGAKRE